MVKLFLFEVVLFAIIGIINVFLLIQINVKLDEVVKFTKPEALNVLPESYIL